MELLPQTVADEQQRKLTVTSQYVIKKDHLIEQGDRLTAMSIKLHTLTTADQYEELKVEYDKMKALSNELEKDRIEFTNAVKDSYITPLIDLQRSYEVIMGEASAHELQVRKLFTAEAKKRTDRINQRLALDNYYKQSPTLIAAEYSFFLDTVYAKTMHDELKAEEPDIMVVMDALDAVNVQDCIDRFKANCPKTPDLTEKELANEIKVLEERYFPSVVFPTSHRDKLIDIAMQTLATSSKKDADVFTDLQDMALKSADALKRVSDLSTPAPKVTFKPTAKVKTTISLVLPRVVTDADVKKIVPFFMQNYDLLISKTKVKDLKLLSVQSMVNAINAAINDGLLGDQIPYPVQEKEK